MSPYRRRPQISSPPDRRMFPGEHIIVFWSGSDELAGMQKNKEMSRANKHLAMLCREFEPASAIAGHHEDLYGMPKMVDAHMSGVKAPLHNVGIATTSGRKLALALSQHCARQGQQGRHAHGSMPTQGSRLRCVAELIATVALQLPLSLAMELRQSTGRRTNVNHIYAYDDEVYLSEDVTDVQASMAGLMPAMPSFSGVAKHAPADDRYRLSPPNGGIYNATVRTVSIEFQRIA